MRGAARRVLAAAGLTLLLGIAGAAAAQEQAPPDVPAGPATLRGRVLLPDGSPVAGAPVVLYALSQQGVPGLRRAETDADGGFVFAGISNAADVAYLVGARYEGVPYPGERVMLSGARERRVEIRVRPVTRAAGTVRVGERRLRLEPSGGRLAVAETLVVDNAGDATVYVPEEARGEAAPALRVALPEDLLDFRMPLGVVPEGVQREGGDLRFWGPVYPGRQELTWFYELPPEPAEAAQGAEEAEGALPERFVWRAPVAVPLQLEVPPRGATLTAPGAALEELPAPEDEEAPELRRLAVRPPPGGPLALVVRTPPARVAPEAVRPLEARLVLHVDAAAVDVTETHVVEVEGDETVRAAPDRALLRIPLPERATDLRFGSDAPEARLRPDPAGGLAVEGRLPPGESRVELAYRLPVTDFPVVVERRFATRLPLLSVFLAETGSLLPSSDRLHRRRPVRTQDLTYAHFEAFEVTPEETVALRIARLPARTAVPQTAWLALGGGLALAAIAFVLAPVWRARSAGRIERQVEPAPDVRERQALYDAIRDLDHDFETGKVSEEDHARLRAELRARAVALLARAREAERAARRPAPAEPGAPPGPEAGPAPPSCAACGAAPRPGDRFCARCGAALRAETAEAAAGGPARP